MNYKQSQFYKLIAVKGFLSTWFFFVILILFAQALKAQTLRVEIEPDTQYQTIDGFGASDAWRCQFIGKNWPLQKKNKIAELLFSQKKDQKGNPLGIGLSIWRFNVGAGSAEQGKASQISRERRRTECFINADGTYDWSKQAGQQWFLRKAKAFGVDHLLAFNNSPPVFWTKNGLGRSNPHQKSINLKKENYPKYADFLATVVNHFAQEGIDFDYVSPLNEPQWDWGKPKQEGTPATNTNIADVVKQVNKSFSEKNLSAEVTFPETADLRFLYEEHDRPKRGNQLAAFFGTSPKNKNTYIGKLAHTEKIMDAHSYFTTWPVKKLISVRKKLAKELKKYKVGYWQSEFCILEKNSDIGGGPKRDLGMPTALYVARVIHADLTLANAKTWQWWTAVATGNFKDGLIYLDTGNKDDLYNQQSLKHDGEIRDAKLLWALGNYARFIRPGMVRVDVDYETNLSLEKKYHGLMISAYKNPTDNQIVLVAVNYGKSSKPLAFDDKKESLQAAYETTKDKNLEKESIAGNNIIIPPRSVVTLVGNLKK